MALRALRRRALLLACGAFVAGLPSATGAGGAPRDVAALERLGRSLRAGDLVFRRSRSLEGAAVLAASAGARFSHVGVAVETAGGLRIVHAVPPEGTQRGGVVAARWETFALAPDVEAAAAYRLAHLVPAAAARISEALDAVLGTSFNAGFTSDPRDGLYCTQVALLALASVDPALAASVRPTPLALLANPVYLPEALLAVPGLAEVRP